MNRWVKRLFILILVLTVLAMAGVIALKVYRLDKKELYADETAILPGIVCIGDSLTHGTGGENVSYPFYLSEMLEKEGYVIPVYNLGVGGENSITIAERVGGKPFMVDGFIIPAETTPVEISFKSYGDFDIVPLRQGSENNSGINPCRIAGVEGNISIIQDDYTSEDYSYEFTRLSGGEEVVVDDGTDIETYAAEAYTGCIQIIFIGSNGGYSTAEDLIDQCDSIINNGKSDDRYLIIGMTLGSRDEYADIEEAMLQAYGDRYISYRDILCDEEALASVGVIPSDADRQQMAAGIAPDCMRTDSIHYTEAGYRLLASVILDRIEGLGYLSDIENIADDYNSKWKLFRDLEVSLR